MKIKVSLDDIKNYIPNVMSCCNMLMGFSAIILAAKDYFFLASIMVIIGAVFDRYDGIVARKLNVVSKLGKEMDSLSDIVTFGLAPSIIALLFPLSSFKILGYVIAIIFIICGWYRLSRYNVSQMSNVYTGLPITIAGCLLALSLIYQSEYNVYPHYTAIMMLVFSYLMVSQHKIKKI